MSSNDGLVVVYKNGKMIGKRDVVVIRKKKGGSRASITVRKISYGVSVERIFPLHSPIIEKIEVVQRGRVRRSRIYYLRGLKGKAARIKERKSTTE